MAAGFVASSSPAALSAAASLAMMPRFHALTQDGGTREGRASLPPLSRPPPAQASTASGAPEPPRPPPPKMSKKLNARLQLAAALIEADNDDIARRAEMAEAEAAASGAASPALLNDKMAAPSNARKSPFGWLTSDGTAAATSPNPQQDDEPSIGPSPVPQPRLASESVIFAPFRDKPILSVEQQRAQKAELAGRLSRLERAVTPAPGSHLPQAQGGRRTSIDFLGVTLPTERRARTRSNSLGSRSAFSFITNTDTPGYEEAALRSRRNSNVTGAVDGEAVGAIEDADESEEDEADALSDWGVDKFLTTEERERVESKRAARASQRISMLRTSSALGREIPALGEPSLPAALSASNADAQSQRARSEFATEATGIPSFEGRASSELGEDDGSGSFVPRYRRNKSAKPADLELLARIKMYRERQETLPPSQWAGPGPNASEQAVKDHILQSPPRLGNASGEEGDEKLGQMSAAGSAAARLLDDLALQTPQQRYVSTLSSNEATPTGKVALPEDLDKTPSPGRPASGFGLTSLGLNLRAFTKRKSSLDLIQQRLSADASKGLVAAKDGAIAATFMTPSASSTTLQSAQHGIVDSQRPQIKRIHSNSSDPDAAFSHLIGRIQGGGASDTEVNAVHTRDASHRTALAATGSASAGAGAGAGIVRPESSFGVICDSWSEQGDQDDEARVNGKEEGEETDDDDMPLGQLQQARLSRTQSQMTKGRSRMSMLSTADTITSLSREAQPAFDSGQRISTRPELRMPEGPQDVSQGRDRVRSASEDILGGTDITRRPPRPGPSVRPHSQLLPTSPTAEPWDEPESDGLPYPQRPFAGGSLTRPASVGPGTMLASEAPGAFRVLAEGARVAQDPFNAFPLGPSPFPVSISPVTSPNVLRGGDLPSPGMLTPHMRRRSSLGGVDAFDGEVQAQQGSMTTKQLQELARQTRFPSSFGIWTQDIDDEKSDGGADPLAPGGGADAGVLGVVDLPALARKSERPRRESAFLSGGEDGEGLIGKLRKRRSRSSSVALDQVAASTISDGYATRTEDRPPEPIVRHNGNIVLTPSSMTFPSYESELPPPPPQVASSKESMLAGFSLSVPMLGSLTGGKALPGAVEPPPGAHRPSVDDSFTSPPAKGPLKPLGLAAREPKALVMPAPLQGSELAPQLRLTQNGVDITVQVTPPEPGPTAALETAKDDKKKKKKNKKADKEKDVPAETLQGPRAPDGFVLHDVRGTAPLRALLVHSAAPTGTQITRPTLAAKPKKHDLALADFLSSDGAARIVRVPATAPTGIGRRAADKSTILFRNHLVHHDEERDGWGWDAASNIVDEHGQTLEPAAKQSRAERRAEKRARKLKRARKKARRQRRALRALADEQGKTYADVGVGAESPVEDLDLSSDSTVSGGEEVEDESSSDYDSDDEKRWVDDHRPAGKLFGKSLLDVADQKREIITKKSRFYGQTELEEHQALEREAERLGVSVDVLSSRSAARSFHDNPLGYNDTRERMQAAFGEDKLWAREMAKRREEDAREEEERELRRLAEEEFQKAEREREERKLQKRAQRKSARVSGERMRALQDEEGAPREDEQQDDEEEEQGRTGARTPIEPPTLDVNFDVLGEGGSKKSKKGKQHGPSETAAEWFARSSDEDEDGSGSGLSSSSEDEATRRKAAMQRARMSRNLGAFGQGRISFAFGEDDSDEERGGRGAAAAAGRNGNHALSFTGDTAVGRTAADEEELSSGDDDMPLAQLKKTIPRKTLADSLRPDGDESSDEDLPLAAIKAKEHRKKLSMGTLDLDFWAGTNSAQAQAQAAATTPTSGPQPSLPSSMAPSPRHPMSLSSNGDAPKRANEDSDEDSDEDRPLGEVYANGAEALAAAREAHAASDDDADEDDKPLGAAYPQAAFIAEQAALIQRLQRENEQAARLANSVSFYGSLMGPGAPMGMGMGVGMGMGMGGMGVGVPPAAMAAAAAPPMMGMGMPMMGMGPGVGGLPPQPHALAAPSLYGGVEGGMGGAPSVISGHGGPVGGPGLAGGAVSMLPPGPAQQQAALLHPKVHQIDSWRHSVRPDGSLGPSPAPSPGFSSPATTSG